MLIGIHTDLQSRLIPRPPLHCNFEIALSHDLTTLAIPWLGPSYHALVYGHLPAWSFSYHGCASRYTSQTNVNQSMTVFSSTPTCTITTAIELGQLSGLHVFRENSSNLLIV